MNTCFHVIILSVFHLTFNSFSSNAVTNPKPGQKAVSVILLDFPEENHLKELEALQHELQISEKYIHYNLGNPILPSPFNRNSPISNKAERIRQKLIESHIPNEISAKNSSGNECYLLVLDYQNLMTIEEAGQPEFKGWKSNLNGYLFLIEQPKKSQIHFLTSITDSVDAVQSKGRTSVSIMQFSDKTQSKLLKALAQKGYEKMLARTVEKSDGYLGRTVICQTNPIHAEIGKSEGLRTDDRFFAYRMVNDRTTNHVKKSFQGVVRATNRIVDNTFLSSRTTSSFYQTAGRKLRTNDLLEKHKELGLELSLANDYGEIGGLSGRLDTRLCRFVNCRAVFLYMEGGFQRKMYKRGFLYSYDFLRFDMGLSKGMQLTRNIEFRTHLGYGYEYTNFISDKTFHAPYFKLGANVYVNLLHNMQLFGGAGFYKFGTMTDSQSTSRHILWNNYFVGREGLSTTLGVKVGL